MNDLAKSPSKKMSRQDLFEMKGHEKGRDGIALSLTAYVPAHQRQFYLNEFMLVELDGVQILLDCPSLISENFSDASPSQTLYHHHHHQSLNIDWEELDVILISNSRVLFGLPLITEYTGFKGQILATEPVVELGRLLLEDLLQVNKYTVPTQSPISAKSAKSYSSKVYQSKSSHPAYTVQDLDECLGKIKNIHFREPVNINRLVISAFSSGHSLGSSNWQIKLGDKTLACIGASSSFSPLGHARVFDVEVVNRADVVVAASVPLQSPPAMEENVDFICQRIIAGVKRQGKILIPILPFGLVFDLIYYVSKHLDLSGLSGFPIHFVSTAAKRSLHLANIQGEWMCAEKQANLYVAQPPLAHGALLARKVLFYHTDVSTLPLDPNLPIIVFADHPDLESGPAFDLFHLWSNDSRNLMLLTDPGCPDPIRCQINEKGMQVLSVPLEFGLAKDQFLDILKREQVQSYLVMNDHHSSLTTPISEKLNYEARKMVLDFAPSFYPCELAADVANTSTFSSNMECLSGKLDGFSDGSYLISSSSVARSLPVLVATSTKDLCDRIFKELCMQDATGKVVWRLVPLMTGFSISNGSEEIRIDSGQIHFICQSIERINVLEVMVRALTPC